MTSSQFGPEDMEALLWGPSSLTADAAGPLFSSSDRDEGQQEGGGASTEGDASPLASSSLSTSSSPHPFYSPPPSPMAVLLHEDPAKSDLLPVPSLGLAGQLKSTQMISDYSREDVFGDLDWMAERMDLSEFDLDSLIGSCSPAADLLSSLDCSMELDSHTVPGLSSLVPPGLSDAPVVPTVRPDVSDVEMGVDGQGAPSPAPSVPEPQEELEIKSEPTSLDPSSPSSPAYTLDLGSEVDVSESEVKPAVATVLPPVPRLVLSLSPTRIVLVLAPKEDIGISTTTASAKPGLVNPPAPASPAQRSTRSRPYPEPRYKASPSSDAAGVKARCARGAGGDDGARAKAPKDKKTKKMEQNKTAATRYRQKKRAEQDALLEEHVLLERRNLELTEKAESMAREIEYLKELMEEVRLARVKGLDADP